MDFLTLNQLYGGMRPDRDELIWEYVAVSEFDTPFELITVNPVDMFNTWSPDGSSTLRDIYEDYATREQKRLVRSYRKQAKHMAQNEPLVVADKQLVDGFHRVAAMALEGITTAKALDLKKPIGESETSLTEHSMLGTGAYTYPPRTPQTTGDEPFMQLLKIRELERRKMLAQDGPQELPAAPGLAGELTEAHGPSDITKLIKKLDTYPEFKSYWENPTVDPSPSRGFTARYEGNVGTLFVAPNASVGGYIVELVDQGGKRLAIAPRFSLEDVATWAISKALGTTLAEAVDQNTSTEFDVQLMHAFIRYVIKELHGIKRDINVKLVNKPFHKLHTAGVYMPETRTVFVSIHHRAFADVMRTIAHEIVHRKQDDRGDDLEVDGEGQQKLEDEANVWAGRCVRQFGRMHPEIYLK